MFFTSEPEEAIRVDELLKKIRYKRDDYKPIFVRRFTHVKNLGSPVLHEYLHVILEDSSTDEWTRVIVERQSETVVGSKARDQMIVRRWPTGTRYREHENLDGIFPWMKELDDLASSGGSSGGVGDLPLPLVTRSFKKGVFGVELLAELVFACHKEHSYYDFWEFNCYWYAALVFESHRISIGHVKDNVWKFASWKGAKSKIISPGRHSKAVQAAAEAFKEAMKRMPITDPGSVPRDHQDELIDLLRLEFSKQLDEMTEAEKKQVADDISRYHGEITKCIKAETERDDYEANRERGKKIMDGQGWNPRNESEEVFLEGPTNDELSALDQCLWAFLGRLSEERKQLNVQ